MYKCSYVEVIAAMLMRSWSRTGRPLRKIHFSNDNVFFPFVVDVLFVYHRQDLYRTWLWDECIISQTGAAYSSRTHRVHETKKNKTKTIQKNWRHRVHKTKKNKTKTIQRNWQHRVHKTKTNKTETIQRNWQHSVHKTKKNKTKTI